MRPTSCNDVRRNSAPRAPRGSRGFTLTELVVTLSVAAILAVLAVPSFNGVIATERAKAAASDLYASLVTARSEAIRLDQRVTISAAGAGWAAGWSTTASNGTTLDMHGPTNVDSIAEASAAAALTYYPSGRLALGTTPMFVISKHNGASTLHECISIDPAGTPYMKAASTC